MRLLANVFAVVALTCVLSSPALAQEREAFPSTDEIKLLLNQLDRSVQEYEPLIDQERREFGKGGIEAADKDQAVVKNIKMAVGVLGQNPQGFNSPAGFLLFEWLDDASRNAVACSSGASTQANLAYLAGNAERATELLHLAQGCLDASNLLYTVSESYGAMYQRYVAGISNLASEATEAAQKCAQILKSKQNSSRK
jgi:hypothetical protein